MTNMHSLLLPPSSWSNAIPPVFDFNPIWNFSRNIHFNLFIIERLSHKNGPVDPNRISINSRPIRYQVPKIVFDKKLSIFYGFLLSWEIVRVTWRMLSMKMFDNTGMSPSRIMQHPVVTILPSDWLQSWIYEALIGPLSQLIRNVTYGFPFLQIITARARIGFVSILSLAVI